MKYILDTNTIIDFLKGNDSIKGNLLSVKQDKIGTSIINVAEIYVGFNYSGGKRNELNNTVNFLNSISLYSFELEEAKLFGEIKASLSKRGEIIGDSDTMIASIAIVNNCVLVTQNIKHFKKVPHLKLIDWAN